MTLRNCKEDIIELIKTEKPRDLHIHSYYSDGEFEPTSLVDRWMEEGHRLISITDHDVIEGSRIAYKYAEDKDIIVLPGIEFDSENELGTKLHILGYGIDYDSKVLIDKLAMIQSWRDDRNDSLKAELIKRGYDITHDDIWRINDGRFIGKPTFARALVNRGYFASMDEAFDIAIQQIDDDQMVKKRTLNSAEVVDTIHEAGGIAVMAHPIEQKRRNESWEEFKPRLLTILDVFVGYGINGLECYHPSASEEQSAFLVKYAEEHQLIITRGSDFHTNSQKRDYSRYHK